jgi:hypothetical protein
MGESRSQLRDESYPLSSVSFPSNRAGEAHVAGMVAGATRMLTWTCCVTTGLGWLFTVVRAPSTLGTFLRTFTFGHVRQLDAVASRFLISLTKNAPILPDADQGCYVNIDDTIKATYGHAKQGTGYGVRGTGSVSTSELCRWSSVQDVLRCQPVVAHNSCRIAPVSIRLARLYRVAIALVSACRWLIVSPINQTYRQPVLKPGRRAVRAHSSMSQRTPYARTS